MKLKVNRKEAYIVFKALHAQLELLKTARKHTSAPEGLDKKREKIEALITRLFPAPFVIKED